MEETDWNELAYMPPTAIQKRVDGRWRYDRRGVDDHARHMLLADDFVFPVDEFATLRGGEIDPDEQLAWFLGYAIYLGIPLVPVEFVLSCEYE